MNAVDLECENKTPNLRLLLPEKIYFLRLSESAAAGADGAADVFFLYRQAPRSP